MYARKSHQASWVIRPGHDGYAPDGSRKDKQAGNTPSETYIINLSKTANKLYVNYLHPVSTFREGLDHEFLVLLFPPSILWVRTNHRPDIILDVLLLSDLVMY